MPFQKGKSGNLLGNHKHTKSRTTREAKDLLEKVLLGQVGSINGALRKLRKTDPARYLDACSKLFAYVLPKKQDITSDGDKISPPMIVFKTTND